MMSRKVFLKRPLVLLVGLFYWVGPVWAKEPSKSAAAGVLQVGQKAPNFSLKDRSGRAFSLEQFRGNLVFINFWATWCPPCVKELPSMEILNQHLKAKNFVMMAISVDDSWPLINQFFSQDPFFSKQGKWPSFLVLHDPDKAVAERLYGCTGWPETYIVSAKGDLIQKFEGDVNWADPKMIQQMENWLKIK